MRARSFPMWAELPVTAPYTAFSAEMWIIQLLNLSFEGCVDESASKVDLPKWLGWQTHFFPRENRNISQRTRFLLGNNIHLSRLRPLAARSVKYRLEPCYAVTKRTHLGRRSKWSLLCTNGQATRPHFYLLITRGIWKSLKAFIKLNRWPCCS